MRVDTHCTEGAVVPPYYDSLLAKVIAVGPDRESARRRLREALDAFVVEGVATTLPFHRRLLEASDFVRGDVHTAWVEQSGLMGQPVAGLAAAPSA
jgi:acetyl-CoA carboxylase biotin carboxylase subunit